MRRNIEQLLSLTPDRVALFGYAHVPWFKKHQRLLEAEGLPDVQSRFALMMEARSLLREAGYVEIGLDHYARPDDSLALAFREGRLRRNFQGYTTDRADTLIGFGPSSISSLPQGFAKHHDDLKAWHARVQAGRLATQKGLALTTDDRVRRALIEDLMCRHACDLGQVRRDFALPEGYFDGALAALGPLETDHVVIRTGDRLRINPQYDLLSRIVASCFDSRLQAQQKRHAQAI
jgi:oxygen-independent coproporphyrinogen-3 oxidase